MMLANVDHLIDNDLKKVINNINKEMGEGTLVRLGDKGPTKPIETTSTGSILLDNALGGGIPVGRTVELYGIEGSGKTTVALHLARETQQKGQLVCFVDVEYALNLELAEKYGVDVDNLFLSQPDSGEQAIDIVDALIRTKKFGLIIIDSVAALAPLAELNAEAGKDNMALQARLMSKAMRKVTAIAGKAKTTLVFINQIREKVGKMFGNPEVTPGGRALKFYSSIRISIRRGEFLETGEQKTRYGHIMNCQVTKNKVSIPFKKAQVPLIYGVGFDNIAELVEVSIDNKVIEKSGSWFSVNNDNGETILKSQGKNNLIADVSESEDAYEYLNKKVQYILCPPTQED